MKFIFIIVILTLVCCQDNTPNKQIRTQKHKDNVNIQTNEPDSQTLCIVYFKAGKVEVLPYDQARLLKVGTLKKIKLLTESGNIEIKSLPEPVRE